MAFSNFIIQKSYSVIDNIHLSYINKSLSFSVFVYEDSSKENILMNYPVQISGTEPCDIVTSYITSSKQITNEEALLVSDKEASGWFIKDTQEIDGEKISQVIQKKSPARYIYIVDQDKYYKLNNSQNYIEFSGIGTNLFWDKYLSSSAMEPYKDIKSMLYDLIFKKFKIFQGFEGEV
jgi:hypothetical protein